MSDYSSIAEACLAEVNSQSRYWLRRNEQIQFFRNLAMLKGRWDIPTAGHINVMGNLPYNSVRLATAMLGRHLPYIAAPSRTDATEEKNRASQIEHFLYGGIHATDRLAVASGHDLFRHELPQEMLMDGWYAVESLLDPNKDEAPFQTRLLDPMYVLPRYSSDRLEWVSSSFYTTAEHIRRDYDYTISSNDAEIIPVLSIWWYEGKDVHNLVLATNYKNNYMTATFPGAKKTTTYPVYGGNAMFVIRPDTVEKGLRTLPIIIGPVGGAHWRQTLNTDVFRGEKSDEQGHPFLYPIAHLIDVFDAILSSFAELIETYIHPTIIVKTPQGRVKEIRIGKDETNFLAQNESLEVLYVQGSPPPVGDFLALMRQMMHQGTIPESIMGDAANVASGFLLGVLDSQAMNHLLRTLRLQEHVYQQMSRQWLQQYEVMSARDAKVFQDLWGVDPAAQHFFIKLQPDTIAKFYDVLVNCQLSTPQHELAMANYHQILIQAGLESKEAGREALRLPNPEAERLRIATEKVSDMPEVQLALAYRQLVENHRMVEAQILAGKLGVSVANEGQLTNPRTGLPERTLPTSQALPPAASQGQPVGEVASAAGVRPAGMRDETMMAPQDMMEAARRGGLL